MKTEDFDRALRDKLNSINHTYSNSDIEKVFRHVKKNRRLTWKGLKGSWLFYSLSAAAMVSITALVLYKTPSVAPGKMHEVAGTAGNADAALDTVLTTDSVVAKQSTSAPAVQSSPDMILAGQPAPVSTSKDKWLKKAPAAANQDVSRDAHLSVTGSKEPESKFEQDKFITVAYVAPANNVINEPGNDSVKNAVRVDFPGDKSDINQVTVNSGADPVQPSNPQAVINNPALALKASEIQINDSAASPPETVLKTDSANVEPKKARVLSGISFQVSNQRVGTGLSMDVVFGKYFGITTGLTYNFLNEQQFPDRETMHGRPPHGYNPHINDHFGDKNHVSDISIQNQLLQLPFLLNGRLPLKHNFTLGLSVGTELDLYLYQKVSYTHHLDSMRTEYPNFGSRGTVVPFNSLFFGASISKQWNHFLLNVQPYYSQPVKDLFYKPSEPEFGIGIRLMYSFGN